MPNTVPEVQIAPIASVDMLVPIRGTTPLIVHKFSEKAKLQMLNSMQGKKTPKEPKDPQAEYEAAAYRTKSGYGFPAVAFKAATVGAARFYGKDVKMTELRQFIFIHGVVSDNDPQELVEIVGEPRMREDAVKVGISGHDLRYRPEFADWSAILHVTYVSSCIDQASVLSLIDAGGMGVGVGDWRPEKRGTNGTYKIDQTQRVEVLPS